MQNEQIQTVAARLGWPLTSARQLLLAFVMKNNNLTPKTIAIAAAATLGAIGCFLPFIAGMSLSKIGSLPGDNKPSLMMFLIPFIALLALGGVSLALTKRVARWQGIVGALFAAFVVMMLDGAVFHGKFKPAGFIKIFTDGNIGAKLVVVGGLVALITSLVAAITPDPKNA
jgi:hypothetical protein